MSTEAATHRRQHVDLEREPAYETVTLCPRQSAAGVTELQDRRSEASLQRKRVAPADP